MSYIVCKCFSAFGDIESPPMLKFLKIPFLPLNPSSEGTQSMDSVSPTNIEMPIQKPITYEEITEEICREKIIPDDPRWDNAKFVLQFYKSQHLP